MKIRWLTFFGVWLVLAGIFFAIGVNLQSWGEETSCQNHSNTVGSARMCKQETVHFWTTSLLEFETFGDGVGDVSNYIFIARVLLREKSYDKKVLWASVNWPPGVPFLIAMVKALTGPEAYFPKMLALTCFLLAFTVLHLQKSIIGRFHPLVFLVPFLVFVFPDLAYNTVIKGYVMSEPYALSFLLLSFSQLIRLSKRVSFKGFLLLGVFTALCAYMRASLDSIWTLTYLFGLVVLFLLLRWQ